MINLKEIRQSNGLSQKQVSMDLSIPQTTLFSYESGLCDPNVQTLCKLADYYHVSLDELVGRQSNNINLEALEPNIKTLIQKILTLDKKQIEQATTIINTLSK